MASHKPLTSRTTRARAKITKKPLLVKTSNGPFDVVKSRALIIKSRMGKISRKRQLHEACRRGNSKRVRELILLGANVNGRDKMGRTAAHHAAASGQVSVLTVLHRFGGNLNHSTIRGVTPAHQAAYSGHLDFLKHLIHLGWRVDFKDTFDCTPLEIALEAKNESVVTFLSELYSNIALIEHETIKMDMDFDPLAPLYVPCTTPEEIVEKPQPTMDIVVAEGPWGEESAPPAKRPRHCIGSNRLLSLQHHDKEVETYFADAS